MILEITNCYNWKNPHLSWNSWKLTICICTPSSSQPALSSPPPPRQWSQSDWVVIAWGWRQPSCSKLSQVVIEGAGQVPLHHQVSRTSSPKILSSSFRLSINLMVIPWQVTPGWSQRQQLGPNCCGCHWIGNWKFWVGSENLELGSENLELEI